MKAPFRARRSPPSSSSTGAVELLERAFAEAALAELRNDGDVDAIWPALPGEVWEGALLGPAREMLARPGKGFREVLVALSWRLGGGRGEMPAVLSQLIEMIHAGSLIIDDVEDGSRERRGGPCLHLLHGVPVAINTGNWLYFAALELVDQLDLAAPVAGALRRALERAMYRCHFGQALDLARPVGRIPQKQLAAVVAATTDLKTGSLTALAARAGAVAAGAPAPAVDALARFGRRLGIGLQMFDDLGNLAPVPDGGASGKRHEDLRLGRPTWPWAWAAERVDQISFAALQAEARALPAEHRAGEPSATEGLAASLRAAVGGHGRWTARARLVEALADLERAFGPRPELGAMASEIERLEAAYG